MTTFNYHDLPVNLENLSTRLKSVEEILQKLVIFTKIDLNLNFNDEQKQSSLSLSLSSPVKKDPGNCN
jgi:hypothetical protein